ncbi:MAG: ABC transporter ATP-binding protein [Chloroflexota bacterium]|nr:ABC transporter ATP-binding protein [Chloroflexota bacterium]
MRVNEPRIDVQGVSVRYRVPHERITSFKEYAIRRLQRRIVFEDFWALKGINLNVGPGEAIAIIGRNGAGKSTLLRVIARVLKPTTGRVIVRGSVAPLLEVGAGFHPELTGRENVFLNGTLLGHTRRDIEERFSQIVAFAELGEFIDSPLRTYSSGMATRLGFAVATAWEPDVLLVDELLAVGDEAFQRRCVERIETFRSASVTLLLVSHDLTMITRTCEQAIWLDRGIVGASGPAAEVVDAYRGAAVVG